jgi:predicted Zn-dependent protease
VQPAATQPLPKQVGILDEETELRRALELLDAKNWAAARQVLHALAAKVPQSKQYRSLLCYTRGREAQSSGRAEEAILELQRAVQLDPDLAVAKQALGELQRRRW